MDPKQFSNVFGEIDSKYINEAVNYKKASKKKILLTAACLAIIVFISGFAYLQHTYHGADLMNDAKVTNVTKPFETEADSQDRTDMQMNFESIAKNSLVNEGQSLFADQFAYIEIMENGMIPSLYFNPNYMVVFFKNSEQQGWSLSKGETLDIDFSLAKKQKLVLEIGYIVNGDYHELFIGQAGDFNETIIAQEDGEYYVCVTNRSSANAVIEKGTIH